MTLASWQHAPQAIAYVPSETGRDLRLDYLRGICLLKMVFDHLLVTPVHDYRNWLGFVSAAEGFFFISGVITGLLWDRRSDEQGIALAARQFWRRALHLYLANLALVMLFAAADSQGLLAGLFPDRWEGEFHWWKLLHFNQPYFLHVLPRYVAFLAVAPAAFWCLTNRHTVWLLGASVGVYVWNLRHAEPLALPFLEVGPSWFPILSWQVLFFVGMAMGYHRRRLDRIWRTFPPWAWALLFGATSLLFVGLQWGLREGFFVLPAGQPVEWWLGRTRLPVLRCVNLAAVFGLAFLLVDRLWIPLNRLFGWLLVPFGQNSLYVFLVHLVLVWVAVGGVLDLKTVLRAGWSRLALDLVVVLLIWWMVRNRFLFRVIPR